MLTLVAIANHTEGWFEINKEKGLKGTKGFIG
jgi:hypothetical protein